MANDALDGVRKQLEAKLPPEKRKYFQHSRYLLLCRENNLKKDDDREALQIMLNYSDDLLAAYAMKEAYFNLMDSKDSNEFIKLVQLAVEK